MALFWGAIFQKKNRFEFALFFYLFISAYLLDSPMLKRYRRNQCCMQWLSLQTLGK
jgi:hypothetical protein